MNTNNINCDHYFPLIKDNDSFKYGVCEFCGIVKPIKIEELPELILKPFSADECIKINNIDQYNQIKQFLRNPAMEYKGTFPIYLETANSISRGNSIGLIFEPIGTWSNKPLKVIDFDNAFEL